MKEILAYICWFVAAILIIRNIVYLCKKRKSFTFSKVQYHNENPKNQRVDFINAINNLGNKLDSLQNRLARGQHWMFALQLLILGVILKG